MIVAALLGGIAVLEACFDDTGARTTAARDSATIREHVAEIQAEEARIAGGGTAAEQEAHHRDVCAGVSDADVARVEEQMKNLDRELVTFGPNEMRALQCARSRRAD
jgi:hypothetical protein